MTLGDAGISLHELMLWGFGTLGLGGGVLAFRAKGSADSVQRAKDAAEAGIYSGALGEMTKDRNGWRDAYRDLEKLFRESEVKNARLTSMQEAQDHEIKHLQQQVHSLQRMVGRLASDDMRKALGPDFVRSQMGDLDDLKGKVE